MSVNLIGATMTSPPSDDDEHLSNRWKGSGNFAVSVKTSKEPFVVLGPGQVQPKGYRLTSGRYGELKMGFIVAKGVLEVEVIFS